jgi:hypothetical protein
MVIGKQGILTGSLALYNAFENSKGGLIVLFLGNLRGEIE